MNHSIKNDSVSITLRSKLVNESELRLTNDKQKGFTSQSEKAYGGKSERSSY